LRDALGGGATVSAGQSYKARVCNQTTSTQTVQPNTGKTGGNVQIPTNTCKLFTFLVQTGSNPIIISGQ
jgi:hypothetical protein